MNEGIVSLDFGSLTIPNVNEFIVQTHSGNIISFIGSFYKSRWRILLLKSTCLTLRRFKTYWTKN